MANRHAVERVLVVGGGSEIGLAIVRALLSRHPELGRVVLAGRPGGSRDVAARGRAIVRLSEVGGPAVVSALAAIEGDASSPMLVRTWAGAGELHGSSDLDALSRLARAQARGPQTAEIGREECLRLKALGYVDDCGF